jgi:hypothetical protein
MERSIISGRGVIAGKVTDTAKVMPLEARGVTISSSDREVTYAAYFCAGQALPKMDDTIPRL